LVGTQSATVLLLVLLTADSAVGQTSDPLRVQAEVGAGPNFVGQAFELRVGVIAEGSRPKVSLPRMKGARAWTIGTGVVPITTSGIGSKLAEQNRFVYRFRVLPTRAGPLELPAIQAQVKGRSGRSQPKTLSIQTVPLNGRPAGFLGGVGRFDLQADASPKVVRVGQDLEFRVKVTGSAAWGMTDRPDLGRFGGLRLGLRIEHGPDETRDEPPARTFVYRLRPTQAGEAVLPPVAIAAYDPALAHYVTRVTSGVAIRVVAVPAFDPATIDYDMPSTALSRPIQIAWAVLSVAIALFAATIIVRRIRRRLARPPAFGPERARRFAKKTARLGSASIETNGQPLGSLTPARRALNAIENLETGSPDVGSAARRIYELLTRYLLLGTGKSQGVLTPEEARHGVARLTNSDELAQAVGELTTRCDVILYGEAPRDPDGELRQLLDDARTLFEGLGRAKNGGPDVALRRPADADSL
jgi:hypothetical protein